MLDEKVVLISGSSGRLGACCAQAALKNGANVILIDVDTRKSREIESAFGSARALLIEGNAGDPQLLDHAIRMGKASFGRVHAAIHAAYPRNANWGARFEDLQPQDLAENLDLHLGGSILFSQRIIAHFREEGGGNLIHVSSIQGIAAPKFEHYAGLNMASPIEYSAMKSGIINLTRYLARYCRNEGIRVNCVSPGGILANQNPEFLERYRSSCNSKGMLDAEDVVGTFMFLLSDMSSYVTGQNIIVDDGWSL